MLSLERILSPFPPRGTDPPASSSAGGNKQTNKKLAWDLGASAHGDG